MKTSSIKLIGLIIISTIKKYAHQFFTAIKNFLNQDRKLKQYFRHAAWYLMIGPSNSGKTTILESIKLDSMPSKQFNLPALTDHCEWHFMTDNLLVSTTPPVLMEKNLTPADIPQQAAWESVLRLLKKYRYKKSLNGVIITIDLSTLLAADNRPTQVQLIKQLLQTLYHRLAARIPVYLLFTKCDLIDGFNDFFMNLDHVERNQPWGITLPLNETSPTANFLQHEYEQLIAQLNERVLWRLHDEPDLKRREKIICFPQQLRAYQNQLINFVSEALITNDYFANHCIQFRGMYFTAGQNNVGIQNNVGTSRDLSTDIRNDISWTSRDLSLQNSYFLTGIFNEIIFPEKLLVGNLPALKIRQQRQVYLTILGILLLGLVGIKLSYNNNQAALRRATNQMLLVQPITVKQNLLNIIASLNALQKVYIVYQNAPFAWLRYINGYLPLTIHHAHKIALQNILQTNFITAITKHLEIQLYQYVHESPRDKKFVSPQAAYSALKAYLALNTTNQIAPHWIVPVINRYLITELSNSPPQLIYLPQFFALMLATPFKSVVLNEKLILQTRHQLQKIPLSTRAYWLLQQQAKSLHLAEINLSNTLGESFEQVFVATKPLVIPALYTSEGRHLFYSMHSTNVVNELFKNDLVLGLATQPLSTANKKRLLQELQILYFTDYVAAWHTLINSLRIVPLQNIEQALAVFDLITTRQSPIDRLLSLIDDQAICQRELQNRRHTDRFKTCPYNNKQLHIEAKKMRAIRKNLHEIQTILNTINHADNRHQIANELIKNIVQRDINHNPFEQLYAHAMQLPAIFRQWYSDLAINSLTVVFHEANEVMNHQWQTEVLAEYNANFRHRYPLDVHANTEVELPNFIHFFGTGGTLEKFTKQHLQPYLNTKQAPWRWKTPLIQQTIGINLATLNLLEKAHYIRTNYFANDGKQPKLFFTLKPLTLDSRLSNLNLRIGKHEINYQHGPQQSYEYQWPLASDALKSSITLSDFNGDLKQLTYEGAWSLFRLLSVAKITATNSPNTYKLILQINGYEASFYLTTTAKLSALNLAWLRNFKLATKITR